MVVVVEHERRPETHTADVPWQDRAPRVALATFIAVDTLAAALFLWFGRHQWFYWDEWELLAGRGTMSAHDLVVTGWACWPVWRVS